MIIRSFAAAAAMSAFLVGSALAETAPGDVKFKDDSMVEASLTGKAGDAAAGREYFVNRKLGNCLACHANSDMKEHLFHGEVGPMLDGVGSNYSVEELRAIVVNAKVALNPDSVMPSFYSLDLGERVRKDFVGKTILTAQQVEDIVAYLATLKE